MIRTLLVHLLVLAGLWALVHAALDAAWPPERNPMLIDAQAVDAGPPAGVPGELCNPQMQVGGRPNPFKGEGWNPA